MVLLRRACQRERVELPVAQARTAEHDVLSRLQLAALFLLDLDLDDARRVEDDLVDPGAVTASNLAENAFGNEDDTADEPTASGKRRSVGKWGGGEDEGSKLTISRRRRSEHSRSREGGRVWIAQEEE
jgi:hypothetical protein